MLQVTDSAAENLKSLLTAATEMDEPRVRLAVTPEGVKMGVDQERAGDATVNHGGEPLIVMDKATSDQLYGRKLDVDEESSQLVLS